ncbi:hypothetical protein AB6N24_01610 [Cellulomonas sp. 179-A 4D5 NHS]|uniref:hypothetical protein n=1 Tax=Cellulomonas sp. 179-A 4D5 NHS TaxID=3142378 RepID=UPI0039A07DC7
MTSQETSGRTSRERLMAGAFALGSACFLLGPLPGYVQLVGATADAVTFFVGSLLFTLGGALQVWLAAAGRRTGPHGRADWWAAVVQSAGTVLFNISTFRAMQVTLADPDYDRLVWRPDAFGSICFLVSGLVAYRASARRGWLPVTGGPGWWQPATNLLGCVFFGVSAVAGYLLPASASLVDEAAAGWTTCAGAACFLACALGTLRDDRRGARARHALAGGTHRPARPH